METEVMEKNSIAATAGNNRTRSIPLTNKKDKLSLVLIMHTKEIRERNCEVAKYNNAECDKETQSEIYTLMVTDEVERFIRLQSSSVSSNNAKLQERRDGRSETAHDNFRLVLPEQHLSYSGQAL